VTLLSEGNPAFQAERVGEMATQFEVVDFEASCEELKRRGVTFRKEPAKEFWGWWAEILDQDGNVLGLHGEA
jgi:predicted enzyme related to lactoylglutathione lyase